MQKHLFRYSWIWAMLIAAILICIIAYALFSGSAEVMQIPEDATFVKEAVLRASL